MALQKVFIHAGKMSPLATGPEPGASRMVVLQTVSPDYRQAVWRALACRAPGGAVILAGDSYFDPTILTRHADANTLIRVPNRFMLGRRLLIQRLPLAVVLPAPAVIAELNPRIVTTWAVLVARKVLRRRTILWGHAFPHVGAGAPSERIRHVMRRLADTVVVYSEREREALSMRMPGKDIVVAPNALFARGDMKPAADDEAGRNFIYVGRMVEEKRPDLLLDAFLRAMPKLSPDVRLLMVGDGPVRGALQQKAEREQAGPRVQFYGHVSDLDVLRGLYSSALASVSPGYVGLSITQSLACGVPMIIADREPHSPEIEAAEVGVNAVFFRAGSEEALADALLDVERNAADWRGRSERIAEECRRKYSVETMAERLVEACVAPRLRPGLNSVGRVPNPKSADH